VTSTKPSIALAVKAACRTDIGLVRQRNEDAAYAGRSLFVVADGMSGHVAGDIASATVIEVLRTRDHQVGHAELPTVLGQAINLANETLRHKIEAHPELDGMGTTLVAMLCSESTAVVANVGDSRAYRLRGPEFVQITEDHTYERLVSDAASVPNLPARIARFLDGRLDGRSPDLTVRDLRPGDRYLLCSDGLSSVVPSVLVHETLSSESSPSETAERLVALAVEHGGPDNITVIVMDVSLPGPA
jgi:protein phosphatase